MTEQCVSWQGGEKGAGYKSSGAGTLTQMGKGRPSCRRWPLSCAEPCLSATQGSSSGKQGRAGQRCQRDMGKGLAGHCQAAWRATAGEPCPVAPLWRSCWELGGFLPWLFRLQATCSSGSCHGELTSCQVEGGLPSPPPGHPSCGLAPTSCREPGPSGEGGREDRG